jgi:hypothetical protein
MKKLILLSILLSSVLNTSYAQEEHSPLEPNCKFYVPRPSKNSAGRLRECQVCLSEKLEKFEKEAQKAAEESRKREAKIARERAEWEAEKQSEIEDRDRKNKDALSKLSTLEKENADYDRIRKEESVRKEAVRKNFENQTEKSSREFSNYLKDLQKIASQEMITTNDKSGMKQLHQRIICHLRIRHNEYTGTKTNKEL